MSLRSTIDLLILHADQLVTMRFSEPRSGREMENLGIVKDGALAIDEGLIVAVGTAEEVKETIGRAKNTIDARGRVVTPGLVDPHTHPVFAATREEEFELRIRGASYQEIAASGGGIRSSVRALRGATREELMTMALPRLDRMLAHGTTTVEAKSGYGLTLKDEIKSLQVIGELNERHPIDIVPTFLGAHEVPDEFREDKGAYIRSVVEEMIPEVAQRGLAEFCDVFCEEGVFSLDESLEILTAAQRWGLRPKLHADELSPLGGAELAAQVGAISADHLVEISDQGIRALKDAGVIPVLLPGTTFSLGLHKYAPARKMIDAGLPVALATDFNPGSCMTESVPMIITLACLMMKLTPAEALTAATVNAAHAIRREGEIGSLEVGKRGDLVIWNMSNYRVLPYHFGVNLASIVVKGGVVVFEGR